jgi:excisionase family DNA binding protein
MNEEQTPSLQDQHADREEKRNDSGQSSPPGPRLRLGADAGSLIQWPPIFERVLDSEEAAALLHIHPKTLQRLARNGEIPGFRIGKLWGFRASALNQWLEGRMAG